MGKIVKRAEFLDDAYVVGIPRVETPAYEAPAFEHPTVRVDVDPFVHAFVSEPDPEPHVEQIDWDAVKADAAAIVDRAAADADALLLDAHQRALEIVGEAQAEATRLEAKAREDGYGDGVALGKAAADAEAETMIRTMRELVESARAERRDLITSAEPEVVRLALAIAERVVHQHIALEHSVVVDNVRQALTRLVTREVVTVRVNPADLEIMREHRDAIVTSTDVEHLRVVEDQRVDRGGVVIETDSGTIDAKIGTQLREARRAIAIDEPIVAPSLADGVLQNPAQAS